MEPSNPGTVITHRTQKPWNQKPREFKNPSDSKPLELFQFEGLFSSRGFFKLGWSGGGACDRPRAENFLREGGGRAAGVCPLSVSHALAGGSGGALFAKKLKTSTFCSKVDFWMKK